MGNYIFLDVSFTNTSTLSYNVDEFRIFIEDKKLFKTITTSKISFDGKSELFHEYFLENADIVLLIKDQHPFFVFDRINRPKGNRAILIGNQNGITNNSGRSFVSVIECLDVG